MVESKRRVILRQRWIPRVGAAAAPVSLVALAVAQLWPGLSDGLSPVISWDHGAHLGKAMLTAQDLLPFVRGWTDCIELGVPLNSLYTPTGTLFVLFVRAWTPFLDWTQTYALALVAFRSLVGLSVYRLGRVAGASRFGATLAGVAALADWGDHSEGGWFYDIVYGVWPVSLAMCIFFFGLAELLEYLASGRGRVGARAALLLGLALFSHPLSLLAVVLVVPVVLVVRLLDMRSTLRAELRRLLPPLAIAVLVACWWFLPMLSMASWVDDHGQLYRTANDLGARMVGGEGILNGGRWTSIVVAIGLGIGLLLPGRSRLLALFALVVMLFSATDWFLRWDASRWMPSLGRIMYPRMLMIAKPVCFALVGLGASMLFERVGPALRSGLDSWRGRLSVGLVGLVLFPFMGGVPQTLSELVVQREATYTSTLADWNTWQQVWAWVREQPALPFSRVAYINSTTHLAQASGAFTGRPAHVSGLLVAESFRNTSDSMDVASLRAMNVRYVVVLGTNGTNWTLGADAHRVAEFGHARIYELNDWESNVAYDPVSGAEPRVAALERTRIVIEPRGARVIVVRRAFAPGWRATADGKAVSVQTERVPDNPRLRLVRIEVPEGTERVELDYATMTGTEALGFLATLLGLVGAAWLAGFAVPRGRVAAWKEAIDALSSKIPARVKLHWPAGVVFLPGVLVIILLVQAASGHHFAYDLDGLALSVRHADGTVERCEGTPREGEGRACSSAEWLSVHRTQMPIDGQLRSCLTAHPPRDGALVLSWERAPLRDTLRVGGGINDEAQGTGHGAPVELAVLVDGAPIGRLEVPNGREWTEQTLPTSPGIHALSFEVSARDDERRWFCLDAVAR